MYKFWDSPEFVGVGREPMHSLHHQPSVTLDGTWDFQLLSNPTSPRSRSWDRIQVPGAWTMQRADDPPHYTNVQMPFAPHRPHPPTANPTGVYRRVFTIEPTDDRRYVLHVGAAESVLLVELNAVQIGASKDSHLAAEFDVTEQLRPGDNELVLTVVKWSDASYLEDQDQWWHGGITRSVYVYETPRTYIANVSLDLDFDPKTSTGSLRANVLVGSSARVQDGWAARITIAGTQHTGAVAASHPWPSRPGNAALDAFNRSTTAASRSQTTGALVPPAPELTATFDFALGEVAPWSAEIPNLYDVELELLNAEGSVVDHTTFRGGFRRVQVDGNRLLVNGKDVLIKGVNRHEFSPHTGRTIDKSRMADELALLKRHNFNAIRTSHYPNDPYFLELCDSYGFYVVDEANFEAHAYMSEFGGDISYLPSMLSRVSRMVARDRVHPSVVIWSLGNEGGFGPNHIAMAAWLRNEDPTRPVQYEGATMNDWAAATAFVDILAPMYATPQILAEYVATTPQRRPLILCEYQYSGGNSNGGMSEFWDLFEQTDGLQGGFIWEFMDHALDPDADGRLRYGGDFHDVPNDGWVCINGLVFPDLTPKPALLEAQHIFSPLRIARAAADDLRTVRVTNTQFFADTLHLTCEAVIHNRSGDSQSFMVQLGNIAPRETVELAIPDDLLNQISTGDQLGVAFVVRTGAQQWAPEGCVLSVQHIELDRSDQHFPNSDQHGRPAEVSSEGLLAHERLIGAPRLLLTRAPIDNDISPWFRERATRYGAWSPTRKLISIETNGRSRVVSATVNLHADTAAVRHVQTITDVGDETWIFEEEIAVPDSLEDLARIGISLSLPDTYSRVQWVGLGPHENYPDRAASARLGRWESDVAELPVPYLRPQENGGRGRVEEVTLRDGQSHRELLLRFDRPVQMNVSPYSDSALADADHFWELEPSGVVHIRFDIVHRGLGTSWLGPEPSPQFRVNPGVYKLRWELQGRTRP